MLVCCRTKTPLYKNTPVFNACLEGVVQTSVVTHTAGQCCDRCRANSECAGWSWVKATQSCDMKLRGFKIVPSTDCHSGYF